MHLLNMFHAWDQLGMRYRLIRGPLCSKCAEVTHHMRINVRRLLGLFPLAK